MCVSEWLTIDCVLLRTGDPAGNVGYNNTPAWSEELMLQAIATLELEKAYVSVSAPGTKLLTGQVRGPSGPFLPSHSLRSRCAPHAATHGDRLYVSH